MYTIQWNPNWGVATELEDLPERFIREDDAANALLEMLMQYYPWQFEIQGHNRYVHKKGTGGALILGRVVEKGE